MKQKLFTLLTLALFFCSGAWADEISVTAFKASGSSPYTYECISNNYAINEVEIVTSDVVNNPVGSNQLKVPADGTLTVSAHGKNVTSIVITWKNTPNISANVGTLSTSSKTTTWTGSATSVVLTSSTANQFGSITVTYDGSFADGIGSSVTLSDLTRGLYNSSSIYTIGCTTTPSVYGIYLKGKVGSDINIDTSANSGTLSIRSPKAMSSIVLNWTDSKGNEKNPSMTPSSGTYNSETNTWTASNTTTKEVTFTNGESSKYYLKNQDIELSFASTDPTITVDPTSADPFTYVVGSGPSTAQTFEATLSNQTSDDITVSLQAGSSYYEISDDGSTYGTSNLTIGTGDAVYVRLKSGLSKDTYDGTLRFANEGADNVDIALSGSVTNQTYSVTYNLNGASGDAPTETAKEEDEVFALAAAPTRDCYTFDGWLCNVDGVTYAAGDDYTMTAAPTTFTAQWSKVYASGSYTFENNATVGTSPGKTVTTSKVTYAAFHVDNLYFSGMDIQYEAGVYGGEGDDFKGWKIKTKDATIKFFVASDKSVIIGVGNLSSGAKISYTNTAGEEQNDIVLTAKTNNTYNVKGGTMVTIKTDDANTVTLKKIYIMDAVSTISATVGKNGYTTFASPYALDLTDANRPDGLKAYKATRDGANISFAALNQTVAPGTGLLLLGETKDGSYDIKVVASGDAIYGNALIGVTSITPKQSIENDTYYFVMKKAADAESALEFLPLSTSSAVTIPAGKAYIEVPNSAFDGGAQELSFTFDDEAGDVTGIAEVSTKKAFNGEFYNLNGQKVAQPTKGLYIVNGKKVVIK